MQRVIMVAVDRGEWPLLARKLDAPKEKKKREESKRGTCVRQRARARTTPAKRSPKACRCNLQSSGWSDHLRPVRASSGYLRLSAFLPSSYLLASRPPPFLFFLARLARVRFFFSRETRIFFWRKTLRTLRKRVNVNFVNFIKERN